MTKSLSLAITRPSGVCRPITAVLYSQPELPPVRYYAVYRNDGPQRLYSHVASLTREFCDFSKPEFHPRAAASEQR
ncbi:hypothetical protein [Paraburkholderia sp. UCT2]|uniref:hypothetical protein n=1 Tax=Paraburkholderia sp. UCT2 TaxID=2615208 RepID=UPI001654DC0B|nr:hypothetical protein [Paraburkholderia sp. UCT2]MBC8728620.1 hypothetical protein [Paraburkholderia sp. UCT2]